MRLITITLDFELIGQILELPQKCKRIIRNHSVNFDTYFPYIYQYVPHENTNKRQYTYIMSYIHVTMMGVHIFLYVSLQLRNAVADHRLLWPHGVVPFSIDATHQSKSCNRNVFQNGRLEQYVFTENNISNFSVIIVDLLAILSHVFITTLSFKVQDHSVIRFHISVYFCTCSSCNNFHRCRHNMHQLFMKRGHKNHMYYSFDSI